MDIPASVSDLTPAWLTVVLRAQERPTMAAVRSVSASPLGGAESLLSDVVRLALEYEGDGAPGPSNLVAKLPSQNAQLRARLFANNTYQREADFYREFAADVGIRTPQCLYAGYDTAQHRFCLLLEFLEDGTLGSNVPGGSLAEIRQALIPLAQMHAKWWAGARLGRSWVRDYSDLSMFRDRLPRAVDALRTEHADLVPAQFQSALASLTEWLPRMIGRFRAPHETLIHGDYSPKNIFFPSDASAPPVVFDWQLVGRAPGPRDLVTLFVTGSDPSARATITEELLPVYHQTLVEHGVGDYSLDDLWHDYRLAVLVRFPAPITNLGGTAEQAAWARTGAFPRLIGAAQEVGAFELLRER